MRIYQKSFMNLNIINNKQIDPTHNTHAHTYIYIYTIKLK